jgi:hypothetical protein
MSTKVDYATFHFVPRTSTIISVAGSIGQWQQTLKTNELLTLVLKIAVLKAIVDGLNKVVKASHNL